MRYLLVLLMLLAGPLSAAPVTVTSGEHDGFTRLVFDYGQPVTWQFGRTEDGYELAIRGPAPGYDLTGVFRLIGTSRLAAVWTDPATGNLRLGIACACHAIPFEFRPGIVVVDLRDGPPPKGSSFEEALAGTVAPMLTDRAPPRPRARPETRPAAYNWLETIGEVSSAPVSPDLPKTALAPLRDLLLEQLSRGAAQGVVEMTTPPKGPVRGSLPDFAAAHVRIGDGPPRQGDRADAPHGDLGEAGQACVGPERLAVSDWLDDRPVAEQWAEAMTGLVGEFDRPEADALSRAVRFQLALGFGAEARQLLDAFPMDLPDADLWRAMAYILDDESLADRPGGAAFAGQSACDGPAALWALLAEAATKPGLRVNAPAVRLAFSALPRHLRKSLGPRLAERFLTLGDAESARAIRDAILRAGAQPDTGVVRMEAALEAETGNPAQAEDRLRAAVKQGGPQALLALADLVELRARRGLPVSPEDVPALEAALSEQANGKDEARIAGALILARAASGDPEGAFALLPHAPEREAEVWALLARLGSDAQVVRLALPDGRGVPASEETRQDMARRFLDMGLARPARAWLAMVADPDPLLLARSELASGNAREALRLVAGEASPTGQDLRAQALRALKDHRALAALLSSGGDQEAAARAFARGEDWVGLAASPPSLWQELASIAAAPDDAGRQEPAAPLAAAHQLIEDSGQTRETIGALLGAVPSS